MGAMGQNLEKTLVRLKNTALLFIKEMRVLTYLAIFEARDHFQFLFYPYFCSLKGKFQFPYQGLVPRKILQLKPGIGLL